MTLWIMHTHTGVPPYDNEWAIFSRRKLALEYIREFYSGYRRVNRDQWSKIVLEGGQSVVWLEKREDGMWSNME